MGARDGYAAGVPCWVDMGSPDIEASVAYYGELLGWDFESFGEEAGGYGQFLLRGKRVAGLGPQQSPEIPPYWAVYLASTDVEADVKKAEAAGAKALVEPMQVMDQGSMAVLMDPLGTPISLWQADGHKGAELVNEEGAFCWSELASADLAASNAFYTAAFDWTVEQSDTDGNAALYYLDGKLIGGGHTAGEGEPPFWSVWFTVPDPDAAAARTKELGGSVVMEPNDMSFGRGTVVIDPQGAASGFAHLDAPDP